MKRPNQIMKEAQPAKNSTSRPPYPNHSFLGLFLITLVSTLPLSTIAIGGSATWRTNPTNGDWNTAANWNPNTVPNGPNDIATFGVSTQTQVSVSANIEVNQIVFNSGASPYTITANAPNLFTISGVGVTNNSGTTQNFVSSGVNRLGNLFFSGNATAGSQTVFTANNGAHIRFLDTSTAGDASFVGSGGITSFSDFSHAANATFSGVETDFFANSTAENATGDVGVMGFTAWASAGNSQFTAGFVYFDFQATADNATFTANTMSFGPLTTTSNATLIINDGSISTKSRVAGTARLVLNDSVLNLLDRVTDRHPELMTFGSIEGSGEINLGHNFLVVGTNNLSTVFSGTIAGSAFEASITKEGLGTFTLTGANQYGGHDAGTGIAGGGVLLVNNTTGSGTGKGPVSVSDATLGGSGFIAGSVEVGINQSAGILAPSEGATTPLTLVIHKTLSFDSLSTYKVVLDSHTHAIDAVVANGVSIAGAQFSITDLSSDVLPIGDVFTVIQNTSTNAIAGTFSNLPDGSVVTVGSNTFQADYEGGDGNDLTLTVVP